MPPFDRLYMTSNKCSIVTMAVSCTVFDTFDFKNFATLKSVSSVTQGHRNWYLLIACLQM